PPHEGADDVALGVPVRRLQPVPDHPGESLELADDEPEGPGLVGGIAQGRGLALELGGPPPQRREPRLELRLVDEPLGVAVDEAADAAPEACEPALDRLTREPAGPGPRRVQGRDRHDPGVAPAPAVEPVTLGPAATVVVVAAPRLARVERLPTTAE